VDAENFNRSAGATGSVSRDIGVKERSAVSEAHKPAEREA
jgi:hypothetical protein